MFTASRRIGAAARLHFCETSGAVCEAGDREEWESRAEEERRGEESAGSPLLSERRACGPRAPRRPLEAERGPCGAPCCWAPSEPARRGRAVGGWPGGPSHAEPARPTRGSPERERPYEAGGGRQGRKCLALGAKRESGSSRVQRGSTLAGKRISSRPSLTERRSPPPPTHTRRRERNAPRALGWGRSGAFPLPPCWAACCEVPLRPPPPFLCGTGFDPGSGRVPGLREQRCAAPSWRWEPPGRCPPRPARRPLRLASPLPAARRAGAAGKPWPWAAWWPWP